MFEASQKAKHNCISLILMKCITGIYTSLNEVEETFPYDAVKDLQIIPPSTINLRERKREMRFKKLHIKGTVILGKKQESHQWRVYTESPMITSKLAWTFLIVFLPIRSAETECDPSAQEPTCGDNAQCIKEECSCFSCATVCSMVALDCCGKNICQCDEGREFK